MHLTRESEYALLALGYLAGVPAGTAVSVAEIASARGLPPQFLSKTFQKLARAGIVKGGRGRGRGYTLARAATDIRIGEVLSAIEPPENLDSCLLWQGYCGDANPCPLHHHMKDMHQRIRRVVQRGQPRGLHRAGGSHCDACGLRHQG
jgi:Rrf2 family protein